MIFIYIFGVFWLSLASAQRGHNRSWAFDRWKEFTTNQDTNSWIPWDWSWSNSFAPYAPTPMEWEKWATYYMSHVIANLTGELIRDVETKKRHGDVVREKYEDLPGFKLGFIAAGVLERFEKLTDIFKHYSEYEIYANRTHKSFRDLLRGYQRMQHEYSELRVEKEMFFEIIAQAFSLRKTISAKNNTKQYKPDGIDKGMSIFEWQSLSTEQKNQLIEDERRKRFIEGGRPVMRYLNESRLALRLNGRRRAEITHEDAQEEYKKSLRYVKWLEKWKGFNAEKEGIENFPHLAKNPLLDNSFMDVNMFN